MSNHRVFDTKRSKTGKFARSFSLLICYPHKNVPNDQMFGESMTPDENYFLLPSDIPRRADAVSSSVLLRFVRKPAFSIENAFWSFAPTKTIKGVDKSGQFRKYRLSATDASSA